MMYFKALRVTTLTEEGAQNLDELLSNLPGVNEFEILLKTQEIEISFNENELTFRELVQTLKEAGCSLHHIDAVVLL